MAEIDYILDALEQLCEHHPEWAKDYDYDACTNEFSHRENPCDEREIVADWFGRKLG